MRHKITEQERCKSGAPRIGEKLIRPTSVSIPDEHKAHLKTINPSITLAIRFLIKQDIDRENSLKKKDL